MSGGILLAWTNRPDRTAALERMTQALGAAKQARNRGANVQGARILLKEARAAFEHGDYAAATERADRVLQALGTGGAIVPPPPATETPTAALPVAPDAVSAREWLNQAVAAVKEAKGRGLNVHVAKAALAEAKRAFKAGDFTATVQYANQAVQLCAAATVARP